MTIGEIVKIHIEDKAEGLSKLIGDSVERCHTIIAGFLLLLQK